MRRREPSIHNLTDLCHYGMFPPYLALWYASGGKREEFQRLHDTVISPTCRLLREDLLVLLDHLEEHAKDLFENGPQRLLKNNPSSDAVFNSLFTIARKHSKSGRTDEAGSVKMSLKGYYFEALRCGGEIDPHIRSAQMILPSPFEPRSEGRYKIVLLDNQPSMETTILHHADGFLLRMAIWEAYLSEPFTHWMLSTFPAYSTTSVKSSGMGKELVFTFGLTKDAINSKYFQEFNNGQIRCLVSNDGFEAAALKAIQGIGLPAVSFTRISA